MQKEEVLAYIQESRKNLNQQGSEYQGAENFEVQEEIIEGINCAWIQTPNAHLESIILHFHGGAYFQGSIKSHINFVSQFVTRSNVNALIPEYGLAPENPFPKGLNDVLKIYEYLLKETPYKNIIIAGDSAGGGLLLNLTEKLRHLNLPLPTALIGIYPWVDLRNEATKTAFEFTNEEEVIPLLIALVDLYVDGHSKEDPLISPRFIDLEGFPPLLIQTGELDFLLPQCIEFAKKAEKAGVDVIMEVYQGMIHGWHVFSPDAPEGPEAYDNIASFIQKHIE